MKNCPGDAGVEAAALEAEKRVRPDRLAPHHPEALAARVTPRSDPLLERERRLGPGVPDRMDGGRGAGDRRDAWNPRDERGLADEVAVGPRAAPLRRVHDEVAATVADEVDDRLVPFVGVRDLPDLLDVETRGAQRPRGALRGDELEAEPRERGRDRDRRRLVVVADGEERRTGGRQRTSRRPLRLREGGRKVAALAITSPVERISGPSTGSAPGKRANGKTAAFTLTWAGRGARARARRASRPRRGDRLRPRGSRRSPCSRRARCVRRAG